MSCQVCLSINVDFFCAAADRVRRQSGQTWRIERCRQCGFGWTSPEPSEEEISASYPPNYLGDTQRATDEFLSGKLTGSRSWRGETEKVGLVEHYVSRGRILDVGCGDGKFLWALDPARWDRTGIDTSRDTLALVRSRMPLLQLIEASIDSERLAEDKFDALTFWHVLEHLPHPAKVLNRALALLQPGGWLFISLPKFDSLQANLFRSYWYAFDDVPRHLYHFSERSLDLLLRAAGFEIRRHLFFSRLVSFHSLKHSLLHWSEDRFGSRIPYYSLKPLLLLFPLVEQITGKYAILTTVAQKPC